MILQVSPTPTTNTLHHSYCFCIMAIVTIFVYYSYMIEDLNIAKVVRRLNIGNSLMTEESDDDEGAFRTHKPMWRSQSMY